MASTATSATGSARPAPFRTWGNVLRVQSDSAAAAELLEQALAICRDIGDRFGQAGALCYLGAVRLETGHFPAAAEALEQALPISRDTGYPEYYAGRPLVARGRAAGDG